MKAFKNLRGFTLIELLIVIALIAVLAGAILLALNPARQFALARNSQRWSHASAILNLISQNTVENRGTFTCAAGVIPTTATVMADTTSVPGAYDLCDCLVPTYTNALPYDPSAAGAEYADCDHYNTGYTIVRNATSSRITVAAPGQELNDTIAVTQ